MSKHRAFKGTERRIAARLGGKRTGHLGGEDVTHAGLSVECKHRRTIPQWLKDTIRQAKANADPGKLALAIVHEHGQRSDQDLVILTLADFIEWFGDQGRCSHAIPLLKESNSQDEHNYDGKCQNGAHKDTSKL